MTRARIPRPHEIQAAAHDPRLRRAREVTVDDHTWRADARCRDLDPEAWFPLPTESSETAVAICRGCDVRDACLATALRQGDLEGIWGATTVRERRAMLVAWRQRIGVPQ